MTGSQGRVPGSHTVGGLLGAALAHHGARRVFGTPGDAVAGIEGLSHVRVDDADLAVGLAEAAGRIGDGPGVALVSGRRLVVGAVPGLRSEPVVVTDPEHLVEVVATWDRGPAGASVDMVLDLDLDATAPDNLGVLEADEGAAGMILAPGLRGTAIMVLAGPAVVRRGRVEALRTLAQSGGLRVALTTDAAGMLGGADPLCAGVVGVQEHDVELSGLSEADLVVVTGLDHTASAPLAGLVGSVQVLEVPPTHLATLGLRWQPPDPDSPSPSALCEAVAAVTGELRAAGGQAASPLWACEALGAVARRDTLVAVDAGPAGLWMTRVPTAASVGTVAMAGLRAPGFALSAAIAAALDGRRAVAVVTDPPDSATAALLELAVGWQLDLVVCGWGAGAHDAPAAPGVTTEFATATGDGPERFTAGLRAALRTPGVTQVGLDVDPAATRPLIEALGPVTGWPRAVAVDSADPPAGR